MSVAVSRKRMASHAAAQIASGKKKRSEIIDQLAAELIKSKRVSEAPLLIEDIAQALAEQQKIVTAQVVSRFPLSSANRHSIEALIKKKTDAKTVLLDESIDESLIGGAIITTPELEIDLSVKGKLTSLRQSGGGQL